ncbi:uncharacterized protein PAC_01682 [Phialocephala subalpina]|uniref:Uncharacterized protein n=1 Tax=Phialocephala subalpina TaxID=576137 RepID=A0A1L7WGB6_9HELO|nr:uncharacterized protein PAC_01682 [Phialocephala subalpina]
MAPKRQAAAAKIDIPPKRVKPQYPQGVGSFESFGSSGTTINFGDSKAQDLDTEPTQSPKPTTVLKRKAPVDASAMIIFKKIKVSATRTPNMQSTDRGLQQSIERMSLDGPDVRGACATRDSSSDNKKTLLTRIKDLPCELRLMVFRESANAPLILQALDNGFNPFLHAEFLDESKRIHAQIDKYNVEKFNKKNIKNLLKIRHLSVTFPLEFRAQKITLMNNINSMSFDGMAFGDSVNARSDPLASTSASEVLRWVIGANRSSLRKLVVKVKAPGYGLVFTGLLGFKPREEKQADGSLHLVWEKADGGLVSGLLTAGGR